MGLFFIVVIWLSVNEMMIIWINGGLNKFFGKNDMFEFFLVKVIIKIENILNDVLI